ncbi:UDP-2,3-diacylglucosamine diphosphatase [Marinomonas sp. 15G1-11]|uniref:UDP-2,3-diacylglucosamine hydrolase n=1 Tax=Marinomonas phaeophyticola TaxID=3004091 RepID=A0ABT4JQ20_9GAMM|nr:UDP-2,3-diacylglucosamine diphosphatase [Marinomonas sp. 15G1-11]MCZ2720455.1 UDP-2,3-diacylglucosamine diphosphatase [Marinomonas sp. 15G1-11]
MRRYFISDLHLSDKRLDLIRAFVLLIEQIKKTHDQPTELYILGDFYEAWIGDDYKPEWNKPIIESLVSLNTSHIPVFIMHGNRDFLLGKAWLQQTHASLLTEHSLVYAENQSPILLSHGDEYCTADVEYQSFRAQVRQPEWQETVLSMPLANRLALAEQLRNDSKSMSSDKANDIMDVTETEIINQLNRHQCKVCIHGHTHKPCLHKELNYKRLVLGDWDQDIWVAILEDNKLQQYKADIKSMNNEDDWALSNLCKMHSLII